ncbi:kinase domain-containing protein [Favolaschia claudopus]|uniref:Kinase domain-containing protein n=1 Tax=Favolaschia claudopus TaxID=2862362 RepID=A0AAW0EIP7_9AGAR
MHPSTSDLLPNLTGQFIDNGELELLALLGSGAYGKVYKALDTTSPPHDPVYYAVKCMLLHQADSREAQIQENELMLHQMVSGHPRVVKFHRHFYTKTFVFVVLDLCSGGDFFSAMVEREVYRGNPVVIKKAFGELIDAVEHIHRNSVYHRDIKPENILCNEAGTDIRLADFGLATQVSLSNQFGCGSRFYMSPESLDKSYRCYSARHSDVWALSIILTNMISGRHPWNMASQSDPGFAAYRADNNYLFKALKITRPANDLLKRCFHMNPLRRPNLAELRVAVNKIESFSLDDRLPTPPFPVDVSSTLEQAVAPPSSAPAGDCEKTPKLAYTLHMPRPVKKYAPPVFCITSSSSSSSSDCSVFVAGPPASPPPSSSPASSLPLSDASSLATGTESSAPATPSASALPVDSTIDAAHLYLPVPPKRAFLGRARPMWPAGPTPINADGMAYPTVASNARPMLPTRKQFLRKFQVTKEGEVDA